MPAAQARVHGALAVGSQQAPLGPQKLVQAEAWCGLQASPALSWGWQAPSRPQKRPAVQGAASSQGGSRWQSPSVSQKAPLAQDPAEHGAGRHRPWTQVASTPGQGVAAPQAMNWQAPASQNSSVGQLPAEGVHANSGWHCRSVPQYALTGSHRHEAPPEELLDAPDAPVLASEPELDVEAEPDADVDPVEVELELEGEVEPEPVEATVATLLDERGADGEQPTAASARNTEASQRAR